MHDAQDIERLLTIYEKASAHGMDLRNIRDAALLKLKQIDEQHKAETEKTTAMKKPVEVPDTTDKPAQGQGPTLADRMKEKPHG